MPGPRGTALLVANFPPDVGFAWWLMENFWVRVAALARARGLSAIIAFPEDGPLPSALVDAGIATIVHPINTDGIGDAGSSRVLRDLKVKLIYLTDRSHSALAYARYRFAAGVRTIVTHDHSPGDRPPIGGARGLLKDLWQSTPMLTGDLRICVSPFVFDRARANGHIPASRLAVVQNGIQPSQCSGDRHYIHRAMGLDTNKLICVTVCRASPYKRVDFVIEVARRYVHERGRSDIVFVHCGDGPDLERLQSLAKDADLGEWVFFMGKRSDIPAILCSSDIALHPSKGEAFSLAILEYMNAGLVSFVPDVPSVCQAIDDEETGVVYPDNDVGYVLNKITEVADSPSLRGRLGEKARQTIFDRYNMTQMNNTFDVQMIKMLDRTVDPPSR